MICNFIITTTLMIAGPSKDNLQGTLKVKQYTHAEFTKANEMINEFLLSMAASINSKYYPKIIGVQLIHLNDFECASKLDTSK